MAGKKTSVEQTREEEKNAQVGNMLDAAFGGLGGLQVTPENNETDVQQEILSEEPPEEASTSEETSESTNPSPGPTGPPSGPPSKPPSGPPSGPPSAPPSGPPSRPPSGPPSGPPSDVPSDIPVDEPAEIAVPAAEEPMESKIESPIVEQTAEEVPEPTNVEQPVEAEQMPDKPALIETPAPESPEPEEVVETNAETELIQSNELQVPAVRTPPGMTSDRANAAEAEVARLSAEVARLRQSMAGATEVIEELETPPMPPAVLKDIVIAAHIVSDFARLARQLDREQLIRATMGTIAMLHPDDTSIMISTRNMTMLPRLDERGLCAARLGGQAPQFAPEDWRVLQVVLASASLATGGPAAVIHSHGAYTTAASCEKDLVVVSPIDEIGKRSIGKVVIVDPDDENPDDFLRQIMEALQQGGMRCVVVRGRGAYAVGRDLDQAWANAAMVEHSMRIVLLARQANLKI
ncbi:class II aldolase/adducin family protein [Candidatus Poseidoniaceae archaeon]|nr:class II aldolase/adducin family protein [Candidatus Poseidoniaceae archaeon]